MYRTHTCGQLRMENVNESVCLSGWVQKVRKLGAMTFVDLRDRYGITQLVVEESAPEEIKANVAKLGREFVIQVKGTVIERASKNNKIPTGDIEIIVNELSVLSESEVPPFTIEDQTDGGDEIRMKYRYLDLRRACVRKNLELRHHMAQLTRNYLSNLNFIEVETPVLIKSTPEGARDFVVPSRMNQGQFYALAAKPANFQAIADGFRFRPLFPDRKMFPGRRFTGRPSTRIHTDRLRNVICGTRRRVGSFRRLDQSPVQRSSWRGYSQTGKNDLDGCHGAIRM